VSELLGADTDTLDRIAESVSADARGVLDIGTLAQRALAELQAGWNGPDMWHLNQQWEQQASPQLARASASLDTCAAQLRAQSAAQRRASSSHGGGLAPGMAPTPMTPASPPKHGSPADNATWWRSLSPRQQRHVVEGHPDWIGNRDGVAFTARDQANRALLTVDRARLLAEKERLETDLADNWFGGAFTNDDAELEHVMDKLASLDAIKQTLGRAGERQLLLLDLSPERAQAAIARGNVDTADNVAVLVPGMSTSVSESMTVLDNDMDQLQHRTELENKRADPTRAATAATAATVTWIGYRAPELGWDVLRPDSSVASDNLARKGAARLAPFLQGIGAARDHDAHLSVLGHSYGSTTAALALQQNTGVDDVVFFGSPGLGTSHVQNLSVPAGHTYYIEARWDAVGDLGHFGIDPSHVDGIEHASARESTVVDPMTGETRNFKEVTGHTSYLDDDSTSQYNMSVVVAGVPDRRVAGAGEGVGDVLSWPVPGTYR
jgi:Alpha/beta hydrolase